MVLIAEFCFILMSFTFFFLLLLTEGPGHGEAIQGSDGKMYASGGSHGGDGGAESKSHDAAPAYGSFIAPAAFGSAGGDADSTYKGK